MGADLMDGYPLIADLERRAKRRIPHFAWEYLASGTGNDEAVRRNKAALERITFVPNFLKGRLEPATETELLGINYSAPIGIAPIGLLGLIWPDSDISLPRAAAEKRIPFVLSTVGTQSPETVGPITDGMGWFQLYPPRDLELRDSLLARAEKSGFTTMVVTADVPTASRRERQRKAQIRVPPKIGPGLIRQAAFRPAWSLATIRAGMPRFRTLEQYVDEASMRNTAGFVGANLGGTLSYDYLSEVRARWKGSLVVKGILDSGDAQRCVDAGADAVQVSNHGGRQLDGAIAAIDALPAVVERIGDQVPVLFDSGVRSGLDVARAIALGASFVFCGRAFLYGVGALGAPGAGHAFDIIHQDLLNVMSQTGCSTIADLRSVSRFPATNSY